MRLTVVGSGDAFNAEGRFHSCYLLEGDDLGPVMVDFGATALAALHRLGRKGSDIRAFVLTHLHGDHCAGIPFLIIDSLFADTRSDPLRFVGPPGTEARVRALLDACYGAAIIERPGAPELEFHELSPGQSMSVGGFHLETHLAAHMEPPDVALCLRFTAPQGQSVAFSGDTEMCEGLLAAADGVDILVAECSGLAPPMGRHCTWQDWRPVLPDLNVRRVLLTHLGRDMRQAVPTLLAEAPPGPRLDFADDGLILEILPQPVLPE